MLTNGFVTVSTRTKPLTSYFVVFLGLKIISCEICPATPKCRRRITEECFTAMLYMYLLQLAICTLSLTIELYNISHSIYKGFCLLHILKIRDREIVSGNTLCFGLQNRNTLQNDQNQERLLILRCFFFLFIFQIGL